MFVILYRWRVKSEKEAEFVEAWSEITAYYRENFDSLGSRLHRGEDGVFYAYAQWKTAAQRENAFLNSSKIEAAKKMREAVAESFDEVRLEILADYLVLKKNY
ncbi:MAG TPA: antibiotic biosynthesis monooxygenase [Pyrinomonadaceae bacterium]|jgi:heme-degrading monooxygenase HmoA